MQAFNAPPSRSGSGQINSKIGVPAGKIPEQANDSANDSPVKGGGGKGAVKGFTGSGVINGKIK
mgnify:CR=1 FL=1